jgi:hypothetical protein
LEDNGLEAHNMRLLAEFDMGKLAFGGEGMALVERRGRRLLYVAHVWAPHNFTVLDVSDPQAPRAVHQDDTRVDHEDARSNNLCVNQTGEIMAVPYQCRHFDRQPAGVEFFDLSDPAAPRSISFLDTSGPHSIGTHRVWLQGTRAYISTGMRDFQAINPIDHQGLMIVDISDPSQPREVGRWWFPGTRVGDTAPPPPRNPHGRRFELGYRAHNVMVYPERPDRCYVAYEDGGIVILDISDESRPKMISHLTFQPFSAHTVVPLFGRKLLAVTDEAHLPNGEDYPKLLWLMDMSIETNIVPISTGPMPDREEFSRRGDRYGAHNLHENEPRPTAWWSEDELVGSFFNAGVRVYDIRNPFEPRVIASLIPDTPKGARVPITHANVPTGHDWTPLPDTGAPVGAVQTNDVYADERGVIYATDRISSKLNLMERTA